MGLSIFSPYWDTSTLTRDSRGINSTWNDWRVLEVMEDKLILFYRDKTLLSEDMWLNNPSVLAATRVGLWDTCLDMTRVQYEDLVSSLPWLGPQCISHEYKLLDDSLRSRLPQWFKVMNISISCCLTCLIILGAAVLLTLMGMWYRQATCFLVDRLEQDQMSIDAVEGKTHRT